MTMMDQVSCPVCGMAVDSQTAPSATHEGQSYYFCSQGCRDQFAADPVTYVG